MTVGWGIIGIGGHADRRMAPAIQRAADAKLVAVYSRDQGRADAFAAKHGADRGYADLDRFLADPEVQFIYIGSASQAHVEHAVAAANAGKNILVDKPLAITVEDCQTIIDAAKKNGVILSTGYNQRYQPAHEVARQLFANGDLGAPILAKGECSSSAPLAALEARRKNPGAHGILLGTGTHVIDLLRWWIGDEVEEVAGLTDEGPGVPNEEMAVASLKFRNGVYAQIDCSMRTPFPANDITVNAESGYLRTSGTIIFDTGGKLEVRMGSSSRTYEFRPPRANHDPFAGEVEHLGKVMAGDAELRSTGLDGLEGVRVAQAVRESSATGKIIKLTR
jgi:1,5-anhydro-D-fructose reductase (1,5-anhydro-D-mannitol-forming)